MDFKAKMSLARPRERGALPAFDLDELSERLESDRGRIINSAALRRLQQKTQVFPLERNAAVRSRLTHSLEVQQVGRHIVLTIFSKLKGRLDLYGLTGLQPALSSLVEMACISHDIGNPPFGHFGEFAISDWCAKHLEPALNLAVGTQSGALREQLLSDLLNFEGNAQAIRLLQRLHDMNLTYVQAACMLKYVRGAYQPKPAKGTVGAYLAKKPGFYLSEQSYVEALWRSLNMPPHSRHPLVYVMEAADDISYCLADLEDAVVKGILQLAQLRDLLRSTFPQARLQQPLDSQGRSFEALLEDAWQCAQAESVDPVGQFFIRLRVNLIHPLVQHAADQFIAQIEAVFAGSLDRALMEDGSIACAVVQTFKQVGAQQVYCHREVETLQLRGLQILQGLLNSYGVLLTLSAQQFAQLLGDGGRADLRMLVRRLPSHLLRAYQQSILEHQDGEAALWEFYYRSRLLLDFVSGLTDQLAEDEYRIFSAQ